ncbi:hypothetical protein K438DRAFT_1746885 [Mycena galopus ATCC 62051]|nr:hypothetical protein K438DRAFT_1746885 [Mycena galopus ATCC 62051]
MGCQRFDRKSAQKSRKVTFANYSENGNNTPPRGLWRASLQAQQRQGKRKENWRPPHKPGQVPPQKISTTRSTNICPNPVQAAWALGESRNREEKQRPCTYSRLSFFAKYAGRVDGIVWGVVVVSNLAKSIAYFNSSPRPPALSSTTNSIAQMVSTITRVFAPFIASALFAVSLELNLAGGFIVYIILLAMVTVGIFSSFLVASDT